MPGISFVRNVSSLRMPRIETALMGLSETIRIGDAIVLTTNATYSPALSATQVPVARKLLAADKTAHYKEGTPIAGILGVAYEQGVSNASGVITSIPGPANVAAGVTPILSFPSLSSGRPVEPETGLSRLRYYAFGGGNVFMAALDATSSAATPILTNTLAGFILTTSGGITTYTIHTGAASNDQCLRILGCDESDPLYQAVGGRVFFQVLPSFAQLDTAVNYSTQ